MFKMFKVAQSRLNRDLELLTKSAHKQEIRSIERVSTQCMLFPAPLSKQEFAMYGDFY